MEIVLLRHGKPKVNLKGYLSVKELKQLIEDYARSGIQDRDNNKLKNKFSNHFVICSDLARSMESAKKLGINNIHLSDALFKEADLPHFDNNLLKLPVVGWVVLLRVLWLLGFNKNAESFLQAKERSKCAAEKLIGLAEHNEKIIVVGHGLMNRLIGKQLQKKGWIESERAGKSYWEFRRYRVSRRED